MFYPEIDSPFFDRTYPVTFFSFASPKEKAKPKYAFARIQPHIPHLS
jgi:hypothetical protein